ncbi:MAG TPA: hypothetical protein VGB51_02055 [Actinomycetota bacterium]
MRTTSKDITAEYLRRLRSELRDLPREQRDEILREIEGHIAEATTRMGDAGEVGLRTLLDDLGDPADIAAEARERFGVRRGRAGGLEVAALILITIGGIIIPGLGWLVGVALLWASAAWSVGQKIAGTLLVPGGLALPAFLFFWAPGATTAVCIRHRVRGGVVRWCEGGASSTNEVLGWLVFGLLVAIQIGMTIYLARKMRAAEPQEG